MRTIKFKFWNHIVGRMSPVYTLQQLQLEKVLWINVITLQFTGLLDRNGVEIYEGDILELDDIIIPVTWMDGGFHMISNENQGKSPLVQDRVKHFKVIGNIYQNHELIQSINP